MYVSTAASTRMELIADEYQQQIRVNYLQSTSQLWYQLYVLPNRQYSQRLIEGAKRFGYKALVLTVDHCEIGNRECNVRNDFRLPNGIQPENLIDDDNNDFATTYRSLSIDAAFSWRDLDQIRSITSLPLIIKGIIHSDDARKAVGYGVQGVVVSNHSGRQLDTIPDIIHAVSDEKHHQIDVYIDGGVRR